MKNLIVMIGLTFLALAFFGDNAVAAEGADAAIELRPQRTEPGADGGLRVAPWD